MTKNHQNKDLIEDGWMTVDEFIQHLIPGLTEYLKSNWGFSGEDGLHHPADLFNTASIYMEIGYKVIEDFHRCSHEH